MSILPRFHELKGDAYATFRSEHGALHDCIDVKFPGDLRDGLVGVVKALGRCPGDHQECADPGQLADDGLMHALNEVLLTRVAREVVEGQDN